MLVIGAAAQEANTLFTVTILWGMEDLQGMPIHWEIFGGETKGTCTLNLSCIENIGQNSVRNVCLEKSAQDPLPNRK